MCRRCIRFFLLVLGCALLGFAVFPILAFIHVGEPYQTALVASKIIMLPVGAICLIVAAQLQAARRPQ